MKTNPTPYPDVNEILNLLLTRAQEIPGNQIIGIYLHGSLANGGFDQNSDIDMIVVTTSAISGEVFSALKEMHEQITRIDSPWRSSWRSPTSQEVPCVASTGKIFSTHTWTEAMARRFT